MVYVIDPITEHLSLRLPYWEGLTCSSLQIPSLLGFKRVRVGTGYPKEFVIGRVLQQSCFYR